MTYLIDSLIFYLNLIPHISPISFFILSFFFSSCVYHNLSVSCIFFYLSHFFLSISSLLLPIPLLPIFSLFLPIPLLPIALLSLSTYPTSPCLYLSLFIFLTFSPHIYLKIILYLIPLFISLTLSVFFFIL